MCEIFSNAYAEAFPIYEEQKFRTSSVGHGPGRKNWAVTPNSLGLCHWLWASPDVITSVILKNMKESIPLDMLNDTITR